MLFVYFASTQALAFRHLPRSEWWDDAFLDYTYNKVIVPHPSHCASKVQAIRAEIQANWNEGSTVSYPLTTNEATRMQRGCYSHRFGKIITLCYPWVRA
jgi:hypothetical protein